MPCDAKTINIQGVVTATNKTLWSFDLDDCRVVYMPHWAVVQETPFLPKIGGGVNIKHAHYEAPPPWFVDQQPKVYYLCAQSVLECEATTKDTFSDLLNVIRKRDLNLERFKEFLQRLKSEFTLVCRENVEEFACCVYDSLPRGDFVFKTPSLCQYVNAKIGGVAKGPYWSFGCHPSGDNEVLLGKFTVFKDYGLFMLSDFQYKIVCVLKGVEGGRDLSGLIDRFVVIRKFAVFTEVLQDYPTGIDYLVCDVGDVFVVNFGCATEGLEDKKGEKSTTVLLLKKSMPLLNAQNKPYFLLQLQEVDTEKNTTFFITISNLKAYQFLQINCIYCLTHKNLTETTDYELKRLFPNTICYKLHDEHFNFQLLETQQATKILTVAEAICTLKTTKNDDRQLFTFQGVIKEKDFCKALASRTKRNVNVLAYGTPGSKTHFLYFKTDDYKQETVILYLNNWETMQMPFGLLPDMRILVRNVLPQKQKYFKSTILTSFQILDYTPKVPFVTANLRTENGYNWGNPFNLGTGFLLPNAILVYAQIETLRIRSLRLYHACAICPKTVQNCTAHEHTLQTTITMVTHDAGGRAMVICKSLEVLRVLLDVAESQWGDFCASCQKIGSYQYDRFLNVEPVDFCGALTTAIRVINEVGLVDVEMLCRKLDAKLEDNDRLPLWLCIDARKKINSDI